jgi:hypothetical protein
MLIIQRPSKSSRLRLSGKWSAALIVVCLATAAVLIPVAAHLQPWIEFELVLGAWWVVWAIALSWVLVHAHVVEHDVSAPTSKGLRSDSLGAEGPGCLADVADCLGGGGCIEALGWLAIGALVLVGLVFVVEVLIPGIAFLLYLAVRGMLARVTNHHRNCEDKPLLAAMWGSLWATAYTAPIALIVWAVHAWSRKPM